jgi:hypothetical protein
MSWPTRTAQPFRPPLLGRPPLAGFEPATMSFTPGPWAAVHTGAWTGPAGGPEGATNKGGRRGPLGRYADAARTPEHQRRSVSPWRQATQRVQAGLLTPPGDSSMIEEIEEIGGPGAPRTAATRSSRAGPSQTSPHSQPREPEPEGTSSRPDNSHRNCERDCEHCHRQRYPYRLHCVLPYWRRSRLRYG